MTQPPFDLTPEQRATVLRALADVLMDRCPDIAAFAPEPVEKPLPGSSALNRYVALVLGELASTG